MGYPYPSFCLCAFLGRLHYKGVYMGYRDIPILDFAYVPFWRIDFLDPWGIWEGIGFRV